MLTAFGLGFWIGVCLEDHYITKYSIGEILKLTSSALKMLLSVGTPEIVYRVTGFRVKSLIGYPYPGNQQGK